MVTLVLFVVDALGMIIKGIEMRLLEVESRRKVDTIQSTAFLKSTRILRNVLETRGDLLSLRLQWKTTS